MNTSDFDYHLPQELIAQHPVEPRDHCRLMIVDREKQSVEHKQFFDIPSYLTPGDLLVWNNSKVFKARLMGKLQSQTSDGLWEHKRDVEIFLIKPMENIGVWQVLGKPGKHIKHGTRVEFAPDFSCEVMLTEPTGTILVQFLYDAETVRQKANQYGHIPVPPYVKDEPHQLESYQTVYAKHEGSVAAPTAGFHFTPALIEQLKKNGVEFAEVTLHVGLGTFLPVKSERVEDHAMHSEWVELTEENADKINRVKQEGRRVIAVGTTTVRTLEGIAKFASPIRGGEVGSGETNKLRDIADPLPLPLVGGGHVVHAYTGNINIFITPGFEFRVIDAMITNFHLPKSTLLMLVSAFARDRAFMVRCYQEAVEKQYQFFSFGDAMLIE